MLHLFMGKEPWFRAKNFGVGTGLPIRWQGWAMLALHIALVIGVIALLRGQPVPLTIFAIIATLAPMPLYRARTEGGWHWRWGGPADKKQRRRGGDRRD